MTACGNRAFPTTITIRDRDKLDYLPEPDIFHDLAGHVPMHTDGAFAETLVRFGECAHTAAELVGGQRDDERTLPRLTSICGPWRGFSGSPSSSG